MTVSIPHQLTKADVRTRIRKLLDSVKSRIGDKVQNLEEDWKEDLGTFKFSLSGQPVSGTIRIFETSVQADIELPLIATLFKGKIKSLIEEEGAKILS
ncbi:MAG: polyhydroxyalkanoic acid system family protein [Ferruginibacter sp.]